MAKNNACKCVYFTSTKKIVTTKFYNRKFSLNPNHNDLRLHVLVVMTVLHVSGKYPVFFLL